VFGHACLRARGQVRDCIRCLCSWTPASVDVNDNSNSLRAAQGSATQDLLVNIDSEAWRGKWDKSEGSLIVRIGAGFFISAGEAITFSFQLINGATAQSAKQIYAAASGFYCVSNLCDSNGHRELSISAQAFDVRSSVQEIREPTFEVARIGQSSASPGGIATVSVSLQANVEVTGKTSGTNAVLTLTGLCGTTQNTDVQIRDRFGSTLGMYSSPSTYNVAAKGLWNSNTKELKISIGSVGLSAGALYVFSWSWTMQNSAHDACDVKVAASGDNTFASAPLVGSVGRVDAAAFTTYKIGQTSTRPGGLNFVCITLITNVRFNSITTGISELSKFTIAGLQGSKHKTQSGELLYECPSSDINSQTYNLQRGWGMPTSVNMPAQLSPALRAPFVSEKAGIAATFDFDAGTGEAVFLMDATGFAANTEYVFAFPATNSDEASDCKKITMKASGDIIQEITMTQSSHERALVDGNTAGDACVFKVYGYGFLTKILASSEVLADAAATITVTLRSNVDLVSSASIASKITLSGLKGSKTSDTTSMTTLLAGGDGNVATAFSPSFSAVTWTQSSGVLVLQLASGICAYPSGKDAKSAPVTCIKAGIEYVFAITLTNGADVQEAPVVFIASTFASGAVVKDIAAVQMAFPLLTGCTVDRALRIIAKDQLLCSYKIGQTTSAPGARNSLCVTLASRTTLSTTSTGAASRFVSFTISGLSGFGTDTQSLPFLDSSSAEILVAPADRSGYANSVNNVFCKTSASTSTGCAAGESNVLSYTESAGEAVFFLSNGNGVKMAKGSSYSFCFQVTNPSKAADCKQNVSITVKDSSSANPVSFAMSKAAGAACPGQTSAPTITGSIRSSSNVTGMPVGVFFDMTTNYELKAASILTITGLGGYTAANVNTVSVMATKNGLRFFESSGNVASLKNGTLQITVPRMDVKDPYMNMGALTSGQITEKDDVYEFYMELVNPASDHAAGAVGATSAGFSANAPVASGYSTARRRAWRASHGGGAELEFKFTPRESIVGGESLILDLPHYSIALEGPVFGITSSHAAFATYATQNDWDQNGIASSKARAMFTNGYVAVGLDTSSRSQTNGVDGLLSLAPADASGILSNKPDWFSEGTLWEGTIVGTAAAAVTYPADANGHYAISTTSSKFNSPTTSNPSTSEIEENALVGMRLTCSGTTTNTLSTSVFGTSTYTTESAYILENTAGGAYILVESPFSAATFGAWSAGTSVSAQCRIEYKNAVGKYTGMTVIFDNGKEFAIKQGAGAVYQLSDGSGVAPSTLDIQARAYTISSQLIITAASGESVAAGETVTIKIPASAGVQAPADRMAHVVALQAESGSCRRKIVPNQNSVVDKPDLDTANTMTVTGSCSHAGEDMSIAAKSTIRRVFASPLGATTFEVSPINGSGNVTASRSTAKLGNVLPYRYDAPNVGPHLVGRSLDVYGALSLQTSVGITTDEGTISNQVKTTNCPMTSDFSTGCSSTADSSVKSGVFDAVRAQWESERLYAGRLLMHSHCFLLLVLLKNKSCADQHLLCELVIICLSLCVYACVCMLNNTRSVWGQVADGGHRPLRHSSTHGYQCAADHDCRCRCYPHCRWRLSERR
jgi:hypothetical protein